MDRGILVLTLLPLSVFCFDIYDFFSTPPPISSHPLVYPHRLNSKNLNQTQTASLNQTQISSLNQTPISSLNQTQAASLNQTQTASLNHTQISSLNQTQNDTILIKFSSLSSYRGASMSIKLLVEEHFPGINVTFSRHPPDRSKYITSKLISTAQVLIIMIVMAGKNILLELKMPIPSWFHRLNAHKFCVIAIPWLLGCITINYLQNTEGFEVFFNDELVFCKQQSGRFPGETEIKEIIRSRLAG